MFYLNSPLNFGIPPVMVFQLEVYYEVERLLTGLTAQQKWYSNKTSLLFLRSDGIPRQISVSFISQEILTQKVYQKINNLMILWLTLHCIVDLSIC